MAIIIDPNIASSGLVFSIDAGNTRSYAGSGITVNGLVGIGGTLVNGVGFTSSNTGTFIFDGTNDIMAFPLDSSLDISSSITLESFIYPTAYNGASGGFILCKPASYYLELGGNGKLRAYFYLLSSEGYHESNSTVSLNTWSHVVVTRNSSDSTINLFINGNLDRTLTSITGNIRVQQTYPLMIGSFQAAGYQLAGRLSSGKIYNRALSASEIKNNFEATRDRYGI